MPKATCPACGKSVTVHEEDAILYERVTCPNCDALLEVIDEEPLMLDEVTDE
jgi:lysine biosynthesis protein LysW